MKICSKCRRLKAEQEFHRCEFSKDGLQPRCKSCVKLNNRMWLKKNRAKKKLYNVARERRLGFIKLFPNPFNNSEIIEWHHIDDVYVVALPRGLHQLYAGRNASQHIENLSHIVEQVYIETQSL